jgi:hypothetical protein
MATLVIIYDKSGYSLYLLISLLFMTHTTKSQAQFPCYYCGIQTADNSSNRHLTYEYATGATILVPCCCECKHDTERKTLKDIEQQLRYTQRDITSVNTKALLTIYGCTPIKTQQDAQLRGAIIEELDKRNPEAMQKWLDDEYTCDSHLQMGLQYYYGFSTINPRKATDDNTK